MSSALQTIQESNAYKLLELVNAAAEEAARKKERMNIRNRLRDIAPPLWEINVLYES